MTRICYAPRLALILVLVGAAATGCNAPGTTRLGPPPGPDPWDDVPKSPEGAYQRDVGVHRIVVLHTNDIHGQRGSVDGQGGLAALAGDVERARAEAEKRGATVIVLDAGDLFSGSSIKNDQGDAIVDYMNLVRYDALTIGVADFERGADNLARLAGRAQFPFLAANLVDVRTGEPPGWVQPYRIIEIGPLKLAVIGLVTPEANERVSAANRGDLAFVDPAAALKGVARELAKRRVDLAILLSHQGREADLRLLELATDLALVVSGASEESLERGGRVGRVGEMLLVTTQGRTRALGRVELVVSAGTRKLLAAKATVTPVDPKAGPPHPGIKDPGAGVVDTVRVELPRALPRVAFDATAPSSSAFGNAVADALVAAGRGAGAELALVLRGDLRGDLAAGPLSQSQLDAALAGSGEDLVVVEIEGAAIEDAIAATLDAGAGGFEVSSNVQVTFDPSRPAGSRFAKLGVAGSFDRAKAYKVALAPRLATSHPQLSKGAAKPVPVGMSVGDAVVAFIKAGLDPAKLAETRIAPVGAGDRVVRAAVLVTSEGADAARLTVSASAWFKAMKGNGRLAGEEPREGVERVRLAAGDGETAVILLVGAEYLAPLRATAPSFPAKRFVLLTTQAVEGDVPPNASIVRLELPPDDTDPCARLSDAIAERVLGEPTGRVEILR